MQSNKHTVIQSIFFVIQSYCHIEVQLYSLRGWLHERFHVRFHVRFTVNRRCDLVYLRFGVAHGIATDYT
jgi:hypothetical protein